MTRITISDHAVVRRRARTTTGGLRQRAWWVIRRRVEFTLSDLLSVLATGAERDATGNLRKYLQALTRAGILSGRQKVVPGSAPTSNGLMRYRLEINAGRAAPVFRKSRGEVFDPNSRTTYPIGKDANAT